MGLLSDLMDNTAKAGQTAIATGGPAATPAPSPAPAPATGNSDASHAVVTAANGYGVNVADVATPGGSVGTAPGGGTVSQATNPVMGVINNVQSGTYTPGQAGNTQASTSDVNVSPDQLVENRVSGIIDANSPLMQRAAAQGQMGAASRGLANSSLAVGAAQTAVLDAATPIASADASTLAAAARQNASEVNTTSRFNAGQENTTSQFNTTAENQASQFGLDESLKAQLANQDADTKAVLASYDGALKTAMANADAANKQVLMNLDNQAKIAMTNLDGKWKVQIQSTASASDAYRQMTQNISAIVTDKDMDGASKQAAIDHQAHMFDGYMTLQNQVSGLNLSGMLSFSTSSGMASPMLGPPTTTKKLGPFAINRN
jgi:hypothetical protein